MPPTRIDSGITDEVRNNAFNSRRNNSNGGTTLTDAINNVDIGAIINEQLNQSKEITEKSDAERAGALNSAQGLQDTITSLLTRLSGGGGPTELEGFLEGEIRNRAENPFELDTDKLSAGFRSRAARGLRDILDQQALNFASRGLSGSGISQGQEALLSQQVLDSIIGNDRELALQAAEGRENSINTTLGLGNQLAGIQNSRLSNELSNATGLAGVSAGIQQLLSSLAAPNRELPDFSGFASLALDKQNADQGAQQQAAALEILARQLGLEPIVQGPNGVIPGATQNAQNDFFNRLLGGLS